MWFGRWLRRYAVFLRQSECATLLVSQSSVKKLCRTLLAPEVPAWQRLQAVRAIEFYGNQVLETAEPDLLEIQPRCMGLKDNQCEGSVHVARFKARRGGA